MPSLRGLLHKHDDLSTNDPSAQKPVAQPIPTSPPAPEITLLRSDTLSQEVITPPAFAFEDQPVYSPDSERPSSSTSRRSFQLFNRSSRTPSLSSPSPSRRRLSNFLHLDNRSRSNSRDSSVNIPVDLPQILDDQGGNQQDREAQWEKRATVLVQHNSHHFGPSGLPSPRLSEGDLAEPQTRSRSSSRSHLADPEDDVNIQEAIRLHESGDLERSTLMFGRLADPHGANNPLSQVLYGLALRHGWGCIKDEALAITYLSAAASNSAAVENEALRAGIKKGGAAKGELVLAIFELANCFRNGWGVGKDPAAARQYYETAANLGDADAMNEVAWCYLDGFGGKKDKFKAAKYYRLAEESGNRTVGNSWIWKEKYNPQ
ncbi:hypothetical protein N7492_001374 [Penicillium capsulatum]|uniref:Tetratricopeptide-like helical n=1 Tax=Penicillium capsulatum TaxID=69766 RepID=A0A9W9LZN1_9EURO|nr:hypothetical protein N7492_001374 [Penicillium capsulatum]KAJ6129573.1 hypothetical protein N7512_002353 [Penicillium capsulatum]